MSWSSNVWSLADAGLVCLGAALDLLKGCVLRVGRVHWAQQSMSLCVSLGLLIVWGCAAEMQSLPAGEEDERVVGPDASSGLGEGGQNSNPTSTERTVIRVGGTDSQQPTVASTQLQSGSKGLSLTFESLTGSAGFLKDLAKIEQVTKSERGAQVFMNCDGSSWGFEEATGNIRSLNPPRSGLFDSANHDCLMQVNGGQAWLFSSKGSTHELSYATFTQSEDKAAELTSIQLLFSGKTQSRPRALSVNASEVVYFFNGMIQFYQIVKSANGAKPTFKVSQFPWDQAARGAPVAAASMGPEFWVASKEQLFWLQVVRGPKNEVTAHKWQAQSLKLAPYTRQELAGMFFKGMAMYVRPGNGALSIFGRVAILLPDKLLMTSDSTWESSIKGIAAKSCETCHAKGSKRSWKDSLSYASWTGTWRTQLLSLIQGRAMPLQSSSESAALSGEERQLLVDWLQSMSSGYSGQVVGTYVPAAPSPSPSPTPSNVPTPSGPELSINLEPFRSEWTSSIEPLLRAACAQCHSASSKTRIDTIEWFAFNVAKVAGSLDGTGPLPMPPSGSTSNITAQQEGILLSFTSLLQAAPPQ